MKQLLFEQRGDCVYAREREGGGGRWKGQRWVERLSSIRRHVLNDHRRRQ
jgi:hypothetical protein